MSRHGEVHQQDGGTHFPQPKQNLRRNNKGSTAVGAVVYCPVVGLPGHSSVSVSGFAIIVFVCVCDVTEFKCLVSTSH